MGRVVSDTPCQTMTKDDWEAFWSWFIKQFRSRGIGEIARLFPIDEDVGHFTSLEWVLIGWKRENLSSHTTKKPFPRDEDWEEGITN